MIAPRASLGVLLVVGALWWPSRLAAQDTTRARPDSAARAGTDTTPREPYVPYVPAPSPEVPRGPLPPGSRYSFSRDSLLWTGGLTLSDLLTAIPGVYVARSGFFGLPEYVSYAGRGAAGIELYWDGVQMLPLGSDSVFSDLSHVPLTYLRRVDVEVLPAMLRVYLVSERHDTPTSRSVIRVLQGRFHTQGYAGLFQTRATNGLGVDLAFDVHNTDGDASATRRDAALDMFAKVEWQPTPLTGAVYEIRRASMDRDSLRGPAGGPALLMDPRHGRRDDSQFRFFTSSEAEGMGWHSEVTLASSAWTDDSLLADQSVRRAIAAAGYHGRTVTADVHGLVADRWLASEVGARFGWAPFMGVVLAGDALHRWYDHDRAGWRAHGAVSLYHGPLSLTGEASTSAIVEAPMLVLDTAQRAADAGVRLGLVTRGLAAHVGLVRRDEFEPLPFLAYRTLGALSPTPRTTSVVADLRLTPWRALTLEGWYSDPKDSTVDFQPPAHGRAQVTFRSKFWRTFRSGAFDLKVQVSAESWSGGTAGINTSGAVIALPGATFYDAYIAFQIVGFTAFFDTRNIRRAREAYVPGYEYPRNAQTFGVQWEFSN